MRLGQLWRRSASAQQHTTSGTTSEGSSCTAQATRAGSRNAELGDTRDVGLPAELPDPARALCVQTRRGVFWSRFPAPGCQRFSSLVAFREHGSRRFELIS
ncbi:hypothetical protein MC885_013389 [Smutsia gigantea]|nr:hypothetical protein MC885_013389 [Smutsia gigantea]